MSTRDPPNQPTSLFSWHHPTFNMPSSIPVFHYSASSLFTCYLQFCSTSCHWFQTFKSNPTVPSNSLIPHVATPFPTPAAYTGPGRSSRMGQSGSLFTPRWASTRQPHNSDGDIADPLPLIQFSKNGTDCQRTSWRLTRTTEAPDHISPSERKTHQHLTNGQDETMRCTRPCIIRWS